MRRVYGGETWELYAFLDRSLAPRGPDALLETAGWLLEPGARILDAGCRDAGRLIELVRTNDATGVGVDPVELHVERARSAVSDAGLDDRITILNGVLQGLPYPDRFFDLIWCFDVLEQVDGLESALREAARVLRPRGRMVVFTVLATERLEPLERRMLDQHLANVARNLDEPTLAGALGGAGLLVERREVVGSEWREWAEERHRPASRSLLRLARLRRQRGAVVAGFGQDLYDHVEANLHWDVYQLLGKLQPTVYVLRAPDVPGAAPAGVRRRP